MFESWPKPDTLGLYPLPVTVGTGHLPTGMGRKIETVTHLTKVIDYTINTVQSLNKNVYRPTRNGLLESKTSMNNQTI